MKLKNVLFLVLATLLISACNFSLAADITPPPGARPPATAAQAEPVSGALYPLVAPNPGAGQEIFVEKCAPCHGVQGLGDGERAADLPNPVTAIGTPEVARLASPADWYNMVSTGNLERFMPPFPSLNDRQRWDVVAYTFSLSEPPASVEQGNVLYGQYCADCHGMGGEGDGPQAAGQTLPNFVDQEYMAVRSADMLFRAISDGITPGMPAFAGQLNEDELWSLATYLRSLTYTQAGDLAAQEQGGQAGDSSGEVASTPAPSATETLTPTISAGIISGEVINASGGQIPVGAEVILHGFDDMQLAISQTVTIAPDGVYRFENIAMPPGRMFFTTLQHLGVTYGSDVSAHQPENNILELPVTVYDTTQDISNLKIDRLHLFFEQLDEKTMRVAELLVMSNTGDKTVVPAAPGEAAVDFRLPAGFKDLRFQDGEIGGRFIQTPDGFGDTAPIYPGQGDYQIILAYTLPFNRKLELVKPVDLPTEAVVVLAPQDLFKIKGAGLQDAGTRDFEGIPYQMYNLDSLGKGDLIEVSVSRSSGLLLSGGAMTSLVIGLGALGLALLFGGLIMYLRGRRAAEEEDEDADELLEGGENEGIDSSGSAAPGAHAETKEELMDAILALDDLHHAGQIDEEAYIERRSSLKARLKKLLES